MEFVTYTYSDQPIALTQMNWCRKLSKSIQAHKGITTKLYSGTNRIADKFYNCAEKLYKSSSRYILACFLHVSNL